MGLSSNKKIKTNSDLIIEEVKKDKSLNINKNSKANFTLINSIKYECKQSIKGIAEKRLVKELNNVLFAEGFEIYGFIDNKIIGVLEGPPHTIYENGYFLFELEYSNNYPFSPPHFYFKTFIFHPNINDKGFLNIDI